MNYLDPAFGGFMPHKDRDAAAKFVLNVILMDHRIDELASIATEGHAIGAIEGEPSWRLERRDLDPQIAKSPSYSSWPTYARFRAYVDATGYELAYPEFFMDRATFDRLVARALEAYVRANESMSSSAPVQAVRLALTGAGLNNS